jgi:phosphomannomutase
VKREDHHGWTLVVPDPDRPVTHVYAEGPTVAVSDERAAKAAAEIRGILGGT